MTEDLLLGVDVGTSSVKVVLCRPSGEVVARTDASYRSAGWREQDPSDWWDALVDATRHALRSETASGGRVVALALSTQGGTLVPVDDHARPTRPAILWSDTRCVAERALVADAVGEEKVFDLTGWRLGTALNLLQIIWLGRNEPESFGATRRFLSVPDYLALRLTGQPVLDPSNAGVNQLADYRKGDWAPELLAAAGIDDSALGEILPAGAVVGPLLAEAAEALGLRTGIAVVNGGHDQYCAALGTGTVTPGEILIGSGTAWVVVAVTDKPQPDANPAGCVSRHVVPERFGNLVSLEAGGASLEWWRRLLARGRPLPEWDEITAATVPDPDRTPVFLPFLHGCSFPAVAPQLRGVLHGLEADHDAVDVSTAIMAGVACQTVWTLQSYSADPGRPLLVSGGAARSRVWIQLLADIAGRSVRIATESHAAALGAALLAGSGVGLVDLAGRAQHAGREVDPGSRSGAWQTHFAHYQDLVAQTLRPATDPGRIHAAV